MAKTKEPKVSKNPFKNGGKVPAVASTPGPVLRIPREAEPQVTDENQRKVRFRFGSVDHDSKWSLLDISRDDHQRLIEFMANVEEMTAGELFRPGQRTCKTYADMSQCPNKDVTARLASHLEGLDHMVRLELNGLKRLYGIRRGHEFHIVWWDPNHEVWPSKLKHT